MKNQNTVSSAIGKTPLIKITDHIYAKLESVNPSGSIKDRMAVYILDRAEERGEIKKGGAIVEATSGNTGIAFSMLATERGYTMTVVMPCDMSEERKKMIRAFGATIVEVGPGDFLGAVEKRDAIVKKTGAFCPNQFGNPDNIAAHETTTGEEMRAHVAALPGVPLVEAFVSGIGTGGTLMGVHKALKKDFPDVKMIVVEPAESAILQGGAAEPHLIQGIGDGFIPDIVDQALITEAISVSSQDAIARAKRLSAELGLLVGISSGANIAVAEQYVEKYAPQGIVVTVLPDRQERYFSMLS